MSYLDQIGTNKKGCMHFPVNNDISTEEPQNIQDRAFQPLGVSSC